MVGGEFHLRQMLLYRYGNSMHSVLSSLWTWREVKDCLNGCCEFLCQLSGFQCSMGLLLPSLIWLFPIYNTGWSLWVLLYGFLSFSFPGRLMRYSQNHAEPHTVPVTPGYMRTELHASTRRTCKAILLLIFRTISCTI